MTRRPAALGLFLSLLAAAPLPAADWLHWRGPLMTGESKETLPDTFDLTQGVGKGNLLWKAPVGGRSSPLVMDGKVYTINAYDPGKLTEGERVSCFDADTGKVLWHAPFNVYSAEVVTSRLGWTTLAADPEKKLVYVHTTAGALICLDPTGKLVWQRHLSEEFGRFTGYGGRISSPLFDSGLVICSIINSSWGDQAKGANRFVAFDGGTGEVAWVSEPDAVNWGTYQSTPVVAVIGGQRQLVAGTSGGSVAGMKLRTGELLWKYTFGTGPINPSPVVSGSLVYSAHGEGNVGGGAQGKVVCVDVSKLNEKKEPKLVWSYSKSNKFGLSHPALADGRLYVADDFAELFCFDAKTGKVLWKYKYGTVARGAPLVCGDRLYIFDVNATLRVIKLKGNAAPDEDEDVTTHAFRPPPGVTAVVETHATPVAVNGRLYFATQYDTYCIGDPKAKAEAVKYDPPPPETAFDAKAKPVGVRIFPADATAAAGATVKLAVKYLDANGRELPAPADAKPEWALPAPPLPPTAPTGAAPPPALKAKITGDDAANATLVIEKAPPGQGGAVAVKVGEFAARTRVRVVPQITVKQDFENIPVGAAPGGWVNTSGKYAVAEVPGLGKVLSKRNDDGRIPIARANAYMTVPTATGYTVESDVYATTMYDKLPDMGVVANRYTFLLDGKEDLGTKKRSVRLVSWEARPRVNVVVPYAWNADTWYRVKLTVEQVKDKAVVKAKVWPRADKEPEAWTVEFDDPSPNREGAAALYGYVPNILNAGSPGSNIYYDNVLVYPNGKPPVAAPAGKPGTPSTGKPEPSAPAVEPKK